MPATAKANPASAASSSTTTPTSGVGTSSSGATPASTPASSPAAGSNSATAAVAPNKFRDNEKVLCYHGPLLYEAKCVRSRKAGKSGEPEYFVHYQGWNKNWDEWVRESRILKINPENLEKKHQLLANVSQAKETKKKSSKASSGGGGGPASASTPTSATPSSGGGTSGRGSANTSRASTPVSDRSYKTGNKRQLADDEKSTSSREGDAPTESASATAATAAATSSTPSSTTARRTATATKRGRTSNKGPAAPPVEIDETTSRFSIVIPEELRYVLVSDWDLVTHRHKLFSLPAKTSVTQIMNDYLRHAEKTLPAAAAAAATTATQRNDAHAVNYEQTQEVMLGIKDLFNHMVRAQLLYRVERPQFDRVMSSAGASTATFTTSLPADAADPDSAANPAKTACDVYGSAHLLRFMVKLNTWLGQSIIGKRPKYDESFGGVGDARDPSEMHPDVELIQDSLHAFLAYLETNRAKYFTSKNYVDAAAEEHAQEGMAGAKSAGAASTTEAEAAAAGAGN